MASYFELYRGASLPSPVVRQYGHTLGQMGGFSSWQRKRRGTLLANLVDQGKMRASDMSPQDAKIAGENLGKPKQSGIGGIFGALGSAASGVGGLVENLGEDVWSAGKGLLPGLVGLTKDVSYDVRHPGRVFSGDSKIYEHDIKPMAAYYKHTYGEGNILQHLYEHPLGPILDIATVASLGAGAAGRLGSSAMRRGVIPETHALARMRRTDTREPLTYDKGIAAENAAEGSINLPTMDRYFSQRPLRKALQIVTDKAGERVPFIQSAQRSWTKRGQLRQGYGVKEARVLGEIRRDVIEPIASKLADLSPTELQAFDLMNRGLTSEEKLGAYQERVGRALVDDAPEGTNVADVAGQLGSLGNARKLAAARAHVPPEVRQLVLDPVQSPALIDATRTYRELVDQHVRPHIEDEGFDNKSRELLNELDVGSPVQAMGVVEEASAFQEPRGATRTLFDRAAAEGIYVDDLLKGQGAPGYTPPPTPVDRVGSTHPFDQPTVMPSEFARGFQYKSRGPFSPFTKEGWFREKNNALNENRLAIANIFQEARIGFTPNPNPLLTGLQRPDARVYVDFLAKQRRDVIEKAYSEEMFAKWAVKDNNGEIRYFKDAQEVRNVLGEDYVLTNPVFPIHWFNRETSVAEFVSGLQDRGFDVDSPELMAAIGAEAEDAVVDATFAARKMPGVAIPRQIADYQMALENASKAYENKFFRARARAMNGWRAATLAFMPRWALNTAVGSTMMTTIKGVGPRDYAIARRLRQQGLFETPDMAGIELGNVTGMELLENKAQGVGERAMGVDLNPVSSKIMQKVQAIEDYFRRASAVHSVKGEAQRMLDENGAIIAGFESMRGPRTSEEVAQWIQNNPQEMSRVIEDVNHFSYNFSAMGPTERRIVRQIVPFWGWYKFISGFAYRLPVDHPARTNLMAQIGAMGSAQNDELLGKYAPDWMKGIIPLSKNKGMLEYLSTMGLNPMSQFFNPGSPEGISGTIQLAQLAPDVQSALSAFGVDTLRGGTVPISPEEGVAQDFFGNLIDYRKGREVDPGQVAWFRRGLGSLMRSFPEARIAERAAAGGRSVYPESIPLIAQRPMATPPETRVGAGALDVLEQFIGVAPKPYNLGKSNSLLKKRIKYARTRGERNRKRLEQSLKR